MFVGIDIGGTKCAVVRAGDDGRVLDKTVFATPSNVGEALSRITESVTSYADGMCSIGISCGGPLDEERGIIQSPPNLPGWDDVHISEMLSKSFAVPVRLRNDANACALAEWMYGAGRGMKNMVFLTFGTGLGAGLILDGRLYSGTNGNAGEVGHIRLAPSGPVGYGKTGSFEGFCSGGGIAQIGRMLASESLRRGEKPVCCPDEESLGKINAKMLSRFADDGDPIAVEAYRISGERLGEGLAVIIDILNPEAVIIGSVFTRSGHLLRDAAEKVIRREALAQSASVCRILPSQLGDSIGDIAAVSVAASCLRRI